MTGDDDLSFFGVRLDHCVRALLKDKHLNLEELEEAPL